MSGFPGCPPDAGSDSPASLRQHQRQIASVVNRMNGGKINATGTVTLTASTTTTTLTDARLSSDSVVLFDPKTANAATELYGASMYVLTANRGKGSWTITHANNSQTDRTFAYAIIG